MKTLANTVGIFILFVVSFVVIGETITRNFTSEQLKNAKATCANQGGSWINNPKAFTSFLQMEGQGCDIHYKQRGEL